MPNYEEMKLLRETTYLNKNCNCYICRTGSYTGSVKVLKGRGKIKPLSIINLENGLYGASESRILPPKINEVVKTTRKICDTCKLEFGVGINHLCNSSSSVDNVLKIVSSLPPKQKDQVLYSMMKDSLGKGSGDMEISSKRAKARVSLNPTKNKNLNFTEENLDNFQEQTGASSRFMSKVTNLIRVGAGKKAVPSYYREHASEKANLLKDAYHTTIDTFDVGEGKKEERPVI